MTKSGSPFFVSAAWHGLCERVQRHPRMAGRITKWQYLSNWSERARAANWIASSASGVRDKLSCQLAKAYAIHWEAI